MRLHHLEVSAFGPFTGTVSVDFDQLSEAGLFLLSGATGAGTHRAAPHPHQPGDPLRDPGRAGHAAPAVSSAVRDARWEARPAQELELQALDTSDATAVAHAAKGEPRRGQAAPLQAGVPPRDAHN